MRSPLVRERTFLSKMFRAISFYMIVALCSFFGFIMIFGDVSITPTLPNNAGTAEESGMTKLMNAVLSANNISADLSLKVEGGEINFDADIDAKVDMQNFDLMLTCKPNFKANNITSRHLRIAKLIPLSTLALTKISLS